MISDLWFRSMNDYATTKVKSSISSIEINILSFRNVSLLSIDLLFSLDKLWPSLILAENLNMYQYLKEIGVISCLVTVFRSVF